MLFLSLSLALSLAFSRHVERYHEVIFLRKRRLLWNLAGEQYRAMATEDRMAMFSKPYCEMEDQFLFRKAYTGVPIPDTL